MKVNLIAGVRSNFMKIAPLIRAIEKHNASLGRSPFEPIWIHTGQHYDCEIVYDFQHHILADIFKARGFGYEPKWTIQDGLKKAIGGAEAVNYITTS